MNLPPKDSSVRRKGPPAVSSWGRSWIVWLLQRFGRLPPVFDIPEPKAKVGAGSCGSRPDEATVIYPVHPGRIDDNALLVLAQLERFSVEGIERNPGDVLRHEFSQRRRPAAASLTVALGGQGHGGAAELSAEAIGGKAHLG